MRYLPIGLIVQFVFPLMGSGTPPIESRDFEFEFENQRLRGVITSPRDPSPRAIMIMVNGHGKTNVVQGNWYESLRQKLAKVGVATCLWDKPGCGKSEGTYRHDRAVEIEALEVRAAMDAIRNQEIPGSDAIGFWGISRAGWIVPLVLSAEPDVAFWISVSGPDAKENFGYLLEQNLRIEGRSEPQVKQLVEEWKAASQLLHSGGSYEATMREQPNLSEDPFMVEFFGRASRESHARYQKDLEGSNLSLDADSGLRIYVKDFDLLLQRIHCPVLAIFGEKDRNVNWRDSQKLYKKTIGSAPGSSLTLRTFPDGNHNLQSCKTGGWRETMANQGSAKTCDGYHQSILNWLQDIGIADRLPVASLSE